LKKRVFLAFSPVLEYVEAAVRAGLGDIADVETATGAASTKAVLERLDAQMEGADLCLFDLTEYDANLALKLGVAHKGKFPYAILCRAGAASAAGPNVFADAAAWSAILYPAPEQLESVVRERVVPHVLRHTKRATYGRLESLPYLAVDVSSSDNPANHQRLLQGKIENVGRGTASDARLIVTSFQRGRFRFASIVPHLDPERFTIRYDDQAVPMFGPAAPAELRVEFRDDGGVIYCQTGTLHARGPDTAGRYLYELKELGRPEPIPGYTLVDGPWQS
jgi:hypothetical protein